MSSKVGKDKRAPNGVETVTRIPHQALQLVRLCVLWSRNTHTEDCVRSVSLYPPSASRNGQWLVVGKAGMGDGKHVAFHRDPDALTALVGFFSRWEQGKLDWKRDMWGEGR